MDLSLDIRRMYYYVCNVDFFFSPLQAVLPRAKMTRMKVGKLKTKNGHLSKKSNRRLFMFRRPPPILLLILDQDQKIPLRLEISKLSPQGKLLLV